MPGPALAAQYDLGLVVLSYVVAAFAAYTAIDLAGRVSEYRLEPRRAAAWLAGGAFAMGAGIWAMHFVAMLAFKLPMPVRYDAWTTFASMGAAIATSGFALYVVTRSALSWLRLLASGAIMGAGIATMHYTGMAALRLDALVMYYPGGWLLSIVNAIVCSTVAIWLVFRLGSGHSVALKALAALVMGVAISGMHYTGMYATICVATGLSAPADGLDPVPLAAAIAAVTLLIMGIALSVSLQSQMMSKVLRERNRLLLEEVEHRRRAERVKSEFVSMVSHELRTPLTSINGSLGLIAGGVAGELPAAARDLVAIAARNCERLIRLVNDILDTEKLDSGRMRFEMRAMDLRPLLGQVVQANEGFARHKDVRLAIAQPADPVYAAVDADRFAQLATNLISNAVKFSPAGKPVEISLELAGAKAHIAVRDHGPGIPAEFQPRMFERFSQADGSDSRGNGGTGLGLHIAKALVERMDGTIGFDTSPQGTTFHVRLPLA